MIKMIDIGWAAGFLEGEGCFSAKHTSPCVTAGQKEIEPLNKLKELFGGKITHRTTKGFSKSPIYIWCLNVKSSAAVMMTLYSLFSERRKEVIRAVLIDWQSRRNLRSHNATHCTYGHELSGSNLRLAGKHQYKRCKACYNRLKRSRRAMLRQEKVLTP